MRGLYFSVYFRPDI